VVSEHFLIKLNKIYIFPLILFILKIEKTIRSCLIIKSPGACGVGGLK
jgi:hypothetical protein